MSIQAEIKLIDGQLSHVAGYCYYEDMDRETQDHIDNLLDKRLKLMNGANTDDIEDHSFVK